jgi:2-C-methyl-D-erythritol 4-phosphate cytidylyltransferase / 2-C-methyl-D-erythritol 2,4-cyclodiphosphate synthase
MIRIGQGIDVHPFAEGRPLVLGGVLIDSTFGLAGHSDADAVLHAITDALLGAIGAGDIGDHFPSSDERWSGADSSVFVLEALRLVRAREGEVSNIDVTIVAEKPRLGAHKETIRDSIAAILDLPVGQINVKATTTDHLGFIGRGEGLCALAIATVSIRSAERGDSA